MTPNLHSIKEVRLRSTLHRILDTPQQFHPHLIRTITIHQLNLDLLGSICPLRLWNFSLRALTIQTHTNSRILNTGTLGIILPSFFQCVHILPLCFHTSSDLGLGFFETAVCCYFAFCPPSQNIQVVFTRLVAREALCYLWLYQWQCWIKAQEYRVEPPDSNTQRVPSWFLSGGRRKTGWEWVFIKFKDIWLMGWTAWTSLGEENEKTKQYAWKSSWWTSNKRQLKMGWLPWAPPGFYNFYNLSFWLPFIDIYRLPCLHVSTNVF